MSPLFDYYCIDCMKKYEIIVPLKKYDDIVVCPHCAKKLTRAIGPVMILKNR